MHKDQLDFLKKLIQTPSPAGFEAPAQEVFKKYVKPYADKIETDVLGNVTAVVNPKGEIKVMLSGHADEIGFMVRYIDENGFISFSAIGGVDPGIIAGQRMHIHTKKGPVLAVVGKTAVHLLEEDQKKKAMKVHEYWLDIGVKKKKEAEKTVSIGDPITFAVSYEELHGGLAVSRSFDDKAGCFVVAEVIRRLKGKKIKAAVYGTSSVQEELGRRGVRTCAYAIDAQVGIAVDVTHATDYPGASKKKVGDVSLGKGPTISRGANMNHKIFDLLVKAASGHKIPHQIEGSPCDSGTDATLMQLNREGMATGLISIPNRYMHTPGEVIALQDLENAVKLIIAFIEKLDGKMNFKPV
ncbi:MAG: M42 family metallopeptidase [Armatimonadota bacterium]